uniref:Anaphase-promoting complex subunit 5 n=1 Tax=Neogobius melanostomus TaxID=47308 RepID=A0A8C6UJ96_9GOBI
MASVHESLYFNPMMTNGVVHANVFGIKDWVTPYKISVLALLYEMTASKISLPKRRRLNKLILPLQQGPDLPFEQFVWTVEECCPQTASAVTLRLDEMANGELRDMEHFFSTLPTPFTSFDTEAYKTSVVGLFMRHMLLAYNKLSFSQVYKLYKSLQQYYHSQEEGSLPALTFEWSDMDLASTEDTVGDRIDKDDSPLRQTVAHTVCQACAIFKYLSLKPAALQEELNNMLKFNPDFAEAHYLNYLNSMRVQDIFLSAHSLLHYFDRLILSGSEGKSNGDEGYGRSLRYAALNLASLHCRFGHYQQANLALQEAIRIAQESNDHVCLQHCLYLASLGIQSLVQQGATQGKTAHKLMDALKDTDILHWKHSLSELIEISLAQTTSIWRMYGKSTMSAQQAQLLLNMSSLEPVNFGVHQNNTEAFAVALCHLAELHAEQGLYRAVSEILRHLKEQFPPHTQHAKLWMLCDLKIQFERHMNEGKYHLAEPLIVAMSALDKTQGLYRKALVLKVLNRSTEAYSVLQRLQVLCDKTKCTELAIRVMLSTAELHWESSGFSTALPLLLQALALARQHHLQSLASETILHLAFTQLMLGVPEQALSVLHEAIEPVLAHGSVMDKGRALLLMARCQMDVAGFKPNRREQTGNAAEYPIYLNEAAAYFSKLNCKERLREIHYFQALLYRTLGQNSQCNKSAMHFRLLDQELQTPAPPVSMRL